MKKLKSRRRSKSVSTMTTITPGPKTMMSAAKGKTPLGQQPVPHTSRTKYRTPMNSALRTKAVSADRVNTITPKANPANAFSMLRHARAGEAVFAATGSPVLPGKQVDSVDRLLQLLIIFLCLLQRHRENRKHQHSVR